jgi:AraC-like DNA-binding protein
VLGVHRSGVPAESGILDGCEATTHWSAAGLLKTYYPAVRVRPERILCPAGPEHRIITCGGVSSWEDLALHLVARFCGAAEAVRIAKLFVIGDRSDGQLPFSAMGTRSHEDAVIGQCQQWIAEHYGGPHPVARMVARSGLPERTFKRRFKIATGYAPVDYVQALRMEEAKQILETSDAPTDAVAHMVGYEDPAFFRRLFKRLTGITPARYRQRFRFIAHGGLDERRQTTGRSPTSCSRPARAGARFRVRRPTPGRPASRRPTRSSGWWPKELGAVGAFKTGRKAPDETPIMAPVPAAWCGRARRASARRAEPDRHRAGGGVPGAQPLPRADDPQFAERARACVSPLAAIEIIDSRLEDFETPATLWKLADSQVNGGFVHGEPVPTGRRSISPRWRCGWTSTGSRSPTARRMCRAATPSTCSAPLPAWSGTIAAGWCPGNT